MKKDKELTYTVTEKEYNEGLAKGWTDDDMLRPGIYKVRRARHLNKNAKIKQRVTMYLDADVVEHFKKLANKENAAPYQSQINQVLRSIVDSAEAESATDELKRELLKDKVFLAELKDALAA